MKNLQFYDEAEQINNISFYCLHLLDWPHCVYACVRVEVCM